MNNPIQNGYAIKVWQWNPIFESYDAEHVWCDTEEQAFAIFSRFTPDDDRPQMSIHTACMNKYGQWEYVDLIDWKD